MANIFKEGFPKKKYINKYTYSNSSGAFTVRSVTGDIAITCNANRTFSGCG